MFSVVTKYHKGRHSLFLYNSEIFYAFTQDILRSQTSKSHIPSFLTLIQPKITYIVDLGGSFSLFQALIDVFYRLFF
ncbi:Uncharacterised protein [Lactiplantibacillus plantarum]|nr:Uncharacterised protein [Lactiplantibacillus plantarum]